MKSFALVAALLSSVAFSPFSAHAQTKTLQFDMTVSEGASRRYQSHSAAKPTYLNHRLVSELIESQTAGIGSFGT